MTINDFLVRIIEFLSNRWNGVIGWLISATGTAFTFPINNSLRAVTEKGDVIELYGNSDIVMYGNQSSDSLRQVIDSLRVCLEHYDVDRVRQVVTVTENLQIIMVILTIIISVCVLIGWYWKFRDRYLKKCGRRNGEAGNKEKEENGDDQ